MSLKILLADDSMTAQNMGKKILADAGHEVVAVSNGAAAAKKLSEKFDLIILDVYMPGYSGLEICEKVRANPESAKTCVLLTVGKMEPYKAEDGLKVKADGVIIKPFEASDLLATIAKIEKKLAPAPDYEKTMIFKAPQIKEFQDDTYAEWKETTSLDLQKAAQEAMAMAAAKNSDAAAASEEHDETVNYRHPVLAQSGGTAAATAPSAEEASMPAMMMDEPAPSVLPVMEVAPGVPAFAVPPIPAEEGPSETGEAAAYGVDHHENAHQEIAPQEFQHPEAAHQDVAAFDLGSAAPAFDLSSADSTYDPTASAMMHGEESAAGSSDLHEMLSGPASAETEAEVHSDPTASLLEPTAVQATEVHVTPEPAVEYTSAPQASDVKVERLDGVESGEPNGEEVALTRDPALARHDEIHEFVTKVGVDNPEVTHEAELEVEHSESGHAELGSAAGNGAEVASDGHSYTHIDTQKMEAADSAGDVSTAADAQDDFEARVAAAMANFDSSPAEIEVEHEVGHASIEVEHGHAATEELAAHSLTIGDENVRDENLERVSTSASAAKGTIELMPDLMSGAPSEVEHYAEAIGSAIAAASVGVAAHEAETEHGAAHENHLNDSKSLSESSSREVSASEASAADSSIAAREEELRLEAMRAEALREAGLHQIDAPVVADDDSTAPPHGMVDAELVEQLQAAVQEMPVAEHPVEDHSVPVAASMDVPLAAPIITAAAASAQDHELATALAAAVGAEPPPAPIPAPTDRLSSLDSTSVSSAVSKVVEKMMPIILAELAKELEMARKVR